MQSEQHQAITTLQLVNHALLQQLIPKRDEDDQLKETPLDACDSAELAKEIRENLRFMLDLVGKHGSVPNPPEEKEVIIVKEAKPEPVAPQRKRGRPKKNS